MYFKTTGFYNLNMQVTNIHFLVIIINVFTEKCISLKIYTLFYNILFQLIVKMKYIFGYIQFLNQALIKKMLNHTSL